MYSINHEKNMKGTLDNVLIFDGFPMGSENKVYQIQGSHIRKIRVIGQPLASPMVTELVMKKYQKLIAYIADLLVDDDDSGDSIREALNQLEKFKQEIKNKYRDYLKKKDLEMMSKHLLLLEKEATERYMEIRNSFIKMNEEKRSK